MLRSVRLDTVSKFRPVLVLAARFIHGHQFYFHHTRYYPHTMLSILLYAPSRFTSLYSAFVVYSSLLSHTALCGSTSRTININYLTSDDSPAWSENSSTL